MLVPTPRLLWLTGLVAFPALTLAGIDPERSLLFFGIASAAGLVALIDALRGFSSLDSLSASVPPVSRLVKGRPGSIRFRIVHSQPLAAPIRFAPALPHGFASTASDRLTQLPAAPASFLEWTVMAPERGRFPLQHLHTETTSPFALWLHRRSLPIQGEVRVQPDLASALHAHAAFMAQALVGQRALRQIGKGREFEKLRDYVAGDPVDDIHWRATAKRGRPISKVFQVERTQEVYVVIDASRLSGRTLASSPTPTDPRSNTLPTEPLIEQFIQSALLLGAAAERQGDLFGLVSFHSTVGSFIRADNGPAHFNSCREQLVDLQVRPVTPDFDELASFLRVRLRRRALLLFLTSLDDPIAAENFVHAIDIVRRQHLCVVVQPRASEVEPVFSHAHVQSVDDIRRAVAGHLRWQDLRNLQSILQHRGVTLASAPADRLAPTLITRYLDVKRRQSL